MEHWTTQAEPGAEAQEGALWKARARDLADLCAASAPCEETERLQEALSLLARRRLPAGLPGGLSAGLTASSSADARGLAAMIAAGGSLSAAVALLGERAGYLVSRGPGGVCMATVVLDGSAREETAEGTSPALAVLGAHLTALTALLDSGRPVHGPVARPHAMRLN